MAWRNLHISQPSHLKLKHKCIAISQNGGDDEILLALEDIACIIIDTNQITISGSVLSACATSGTVLIIPDQKHHPAGIMLPFHQHHFQAEIASIQTGTSLPMRKRIWKEIIVAKISNQAQVLKLVERKEATKLHNMARHVSSGDSKNIEAQAARVYWSTLFSHFVRSDDTDRRNALLNYGYSVTRSCLARACVAYGLIPSIGVHHASKTNNFNLIDDLIEPFRPFVDLMVFRYYSKNENNEISLDDRRYMATILSQTSYINFESQTIFNATETVASSLVKALRLKSTSHLRLPMLDV